MSNASVSGGGDVVGPASSTDNAVARFDGTTGNIQGSGVILNDSDQLSAINQITLDVGASIDEFSTDGTLAGDSDTALPTEKAVKTYVDGSHVSLSDAIFGGYAPAHTVNTTTSFPPVSYRDFGSLELNVRSFDQTGPEYMQFQFQAPSDLDTSGTVTFEIMGSASTAAASKNVKFSFDFIEAGDNDLLTGAYGTVQTWDDQPISGTQNELDIISNSASVSDLGIEAGKMYFYRLYRGAATTNNLAADYDVISFFIKIPRA